MNNKPTYISRDGLEQLRKELDELIALRRPEIAQRIHDAKEHGDLSENAEYEDAKNEQAMVEGRIQQLQALIQNAELIDEQGASVSKQVTLGSHVRVKTDEGKAHEYVIVGPAEADPREGKISNESPVGRALIGKRVHDEVQVNAPRGIVTYKITKIS